VARYCSASQSISDAPERGVTSFAAICPSEKPLYLAITLLDEPQGSAETYGLITAAWNAAGKVIEQTAPPLGVESHAAADRPTISVTLAP
jgi:cell division protein FtsI (penicillin-binding protein 3)